MSIVLHLASIGLRATEPKKARAPSRDLESQEQQALIEWAKLQAVPSHIPGVLPGEKVIDFLFAIPNGGARSKATAGKLKAEGVKAGVWDLQLALPIGRTHGLWIEMKAGKNTLTDEQRAWRDRMQRVGFKCVVCWSFEEARNAIEEYIGKPRESTLASLDQTEPDRRAFAKPKREYVRSQVLREAYRLIPCQHCGADDGSVCCAHSNWSVHGKGGGIKADDSRGASLCHHCHILILDQGKDLDQQERQQMWWNAHVKTLHLLRRRGLWPAHIAMPDISNCPF